MAVGGGGTHTGAVERFRKGTVCGLRHLRPLRVKSSEGIEVQDVHFDVRGVRGEGTSGTLELHNVEDMLQATQDIFSHAGCRRTCSLPQLRNANGKTFKVVSSMLASHLQCRRGCKVSSFESHQVSGHDGRVWQAQQQMNDSIRQNDGGWMTCEGRPWLLERYLLTKTSLASAMPRLVGSHAVWPWLIPCGDIDTGSSMRQHPHPLRQWHFY